MKKGLTDMGKAVLEIFLVQQLSRCGETFALTNVDVVTPLRVNHHRAFT